MAARYPSTTTCPTMGMVMNSPPKNMPQRPPQSAPRVPQKLDPVASVVEADDLFIGLISLTDDAEILHLEAGCGQLFQGCFRCTVVGEDGDDCVSFFHLVSRSRY